MAPGSVPGHNSGSMLEAARDALLEALRDTDRNGKTFEQRRAEFLASAAAQRVTSRETAAAAADTIKLAAEVWAMIDGVRRGLSDPYREVHLALSSQATGFWAEVEEAMRGLRDQIDLWTAGEDRRIADQRREQEAALARMRGVSPPPVSPPSTVPATEPAARPDIRYNSPPPAAPRQPPAPPEMLPARRAKIHGDLGSTISPRTEISYEIEDFSLLPPHITQSPVVVQAILDVVRRTAKTLGVPAGIRVSTSTGNQIR